MRVQNVLVGVAIAVGAASAFTVPCPSCVTAPPISSRATQLAVGGQGWDNSNFLGSLGGGDEERNRANDDYYRMARYGRPDENQPLSEDEYGDANVPLPPTEGDLPSQDIAGAALTEDMKAKIKASHTPEEEASQGGQMFKKLLERAQEGPSRMPPPPVPPLPPPPPAVPSYPGTQMPADFSNLSVEEQARLFREMMAQQQQQGAPPASPYPPPQAAVPPYPYAQPGVYPPPVQTPPDQSNYMAPGTAPDGRKVGRNRDADAIVNSADLYFAQLKRDSTTRNYARYRGDDEKANDVFHHPSIEQIKVHVNPYLQEQKKKEKELLDTVPEEMLIFQEYRDEPRQPKNYAGVSYKDKLAQMKAKKGGTPLPESQREVQPQTDAQDEHVHSELQDEMAPSIPAVPVQTEPPSTPSPPKESPVAEMKHPPAAAAASIASPQTDQPPVSLSAEDVLTGDTRADIRTLMGLILKHRGGPGFGAGRLQGEEAARLEGLAQAIPQVLRQEETPAAPPASPSSAVVVEQPGGQVDSMLACIEGAVTMYRNAPTEIQGSVLVTLRAALLSALDTLAQTMENAPPMGPVVTPTEMPGPPTALDPEQAEKVNGMNACIEGAITMYRNSPAQLKSSVLVTLNAALLAAVNTCNEVMAVGAAPASPLTTQPSDEPAPEHKEAASPPQYSGNDANTIMLQEIYQQISNAGGDGPMGLRPDISAEEAKALQDSLSDMRTLLVDELHSGIPEGSIDTQKHEDETSAAAPEVASSDDETSTTSKYAQMLQKAREEKEAKDGFQ